MPAEQWLYAKLNTSKPIGPVSTEEIARLIHSRELTDEDAVYRAGTWIQWPRRVGALREHFMRAVPFATPPPLPSHKEEADIPSEEANAPQTATDAAVADTVMSLLPQTAQRRLPQYLERRRDLARGVVAALPSFATAFIFLAGWVSPLTLNLGLIAHYFPFVYFVEWFLGPWPTYMRLAGEPEDTPLSPGAIPQRVRTLLKLFLIAGIVLVGVSSFVGNPWLGMSMGVPLLLRLPIAFTTRRMTQVERGWCVLELWVHNALVIACFVLASIHFPILGFTPTVVAELKKEFLLPPQNAMALGFIYYTATGFEQIGIEWYRGSISRYFARVAERGSIFGLR